MIFGLAVYRNIVETHLWEQMHRKWRSERIKSKTILVKKITTIIRGKRGTKYQYTTLSLILTSISFFFFFSSLLLFFLLSHSLKTIKIGRINLWRRWPSRASRRLWPSIGPLCLSLGAGCLQRLAAVGPRPSWWAGSRPREGGSARSLRKSERARGSMRPAPLGD